jgi:hypothetical protein
MKYFGPSLAADPVSLPSGGRTVPGLVYSLVYGSLGFGAVSVLAYSIWAYRWVPGTTALYASTAAVYIGLGGLVLSRLVVAPGAWKRFPLIFAAGFALYAIGWCACWFGLRGKFLADLWGAVVGLAGMTWLLQRAFGRKGGFLSLFLALLALHSVGYYAGGELYAAIRGRNGRLLWGAAHGLGFGAGLGFLLHRCQTSLKTRLSAT